MGLIADAGTLSAEDWPRVLERVVEAGILIDERGEEDGVLWCTCRRGRASFGMGLDLSKSPGTVYLYCGALHYWSRPLSTRRLLADMRSILGGVRSS
jgi:hypothetical protein